MGKRGAGVDLLLSSEAGLDASLHALREAVRELAGTGSAELRQLAEVSWETYAEVEALLLKVRSQRARAALATGVAAG